MTVRKRIFVSGVVQVVSFRAYATDEALRLGLRGWVRNRRDRRVECLVEGPSEAVDIFVRWCHRGSPAAKVAGVDARDEAGREPLGEFTVGPTE